MAIHVYFNSARVIPFNNNLFPEHVHKLSELVSSICGEEMEGSLINQKLFVPLYDLMEEYFIKYICNAFNVPYGRHLTLTELRISEEEKTHGIDYKILIHDDNLGSYNRIMHEITNLPIYRTQLIDPQTNQNYRLAPNGNIIRR